MFKKVTLLQNLLLLTVLSLTVSHIQAASSDSLICYNKPDGTVLPIEDVCTSYIYCRGQTPYIVPCPSDMAFSRDIGGCVNIRDSDCKEASLANTLANNETLIVTTYETTYELCANYVLAPEGISADVCSNYADEFLLKYPYNCNAYINCTMGCPILNYCQDGKVFNNILKICDTPDMGQCEELPLPGISTVEPTTTTTEVYTTDEPTSISTTTFTTTTESATPTTVAASTTTELATPPGICIPPLGIHINVCSDQAQGTILAYPFNCSAFIVCNWECAYLEYCEAGNIFNALFGICDSPQAVECEESPYPTPPIASSTASTANTEPITTSTTEKPFSTTLPPDVNPELCRNQLDYAVLSYGTDCSKYLQCRNGDVRVKSCPNGWLFNSQLMVCDESVDDNCATGTTTVQPSLGVCGDLSSGELIEYPDNCQKYISCVRPIPVAFYCNNNWYFDEEQQTCNPDIHGSCSTNSTAVNPPSNICQGLNLGDWQIYPTDCKLYYQCLGDGNFMLQICVADAYFNPQLGECSSTVGATYCKQNFDTTLPPTTTEATTTPKPTGICAQEPSGAHIAYPDNCFRYIVCANPIPVGYNCPTGLQFSLDQQNCVEPIDSDCGILPTTSSTTQAPTPTMPYSECTNQPDFTLLPYAEDCSMFIICIRNLEHFAHCNEGQLFDALQGECVVGAEEDACRLEETTTTNADATTTTDIVTDATTTNEEDKTTSEITTTSTDYTTTDETSTENTTPTDETTDIDSTTTNATNSTTTDATTTTDETITTDGTTTTYETTGTDLNTTTTDEASTEDTTTTEATTTTNETSTENTTTTEATTTTDETSTENTTATNETTGTDSTTTSATITTDSTTTDATTTTDDNTTTDNTTTTYETTGTDSKTTDETSTEATTTIDETTGTDSTTTNDTFTTDATTTTYETTGTDSTTTDAASTKDNTTTEATTTTDETSTENTTTTDETTGTDSTTTNTTTTTDSTTTDATTTTEDNRTTDNTTTTYETTGTDSTTTNETSTEATTTTTEVTTTTTESTTTTTSTAVDPNLGPCYNKPEGTKLPYPNNCTKYIECIDPLPVAYNCPDGLEFSELFAECVIPELADCSIKTTTPAIITTTTTDNPTTETTTTTGTDDTTASDDVCANKPVGSTFPYPADCSKFYMCVNGYTKLINCMQNTYYDPSSGKCDKDISPTACQEVTVTTTTNEPTTTTTQSTTTTDATTTNEPTTTTDATTTNDSTTTTTQSTTTTDATTTNEPTTTTTQSTTTTDATTTNEPTATTTESVTTTDATTTNEPTTTTTTQSTTTTDATTTNEPTTTTTQSTTTTDATTTNEPTTTTTQSTTTTDATTTNEPTTTQSTTTTDAHTTNEPTTTTTESTTTTDSTTTESTTTTDSSTTSSTYTTTPQETQEPCMNQPNGYTYPFEDNCQNYYICLNGSSVLCSCSRNTYYNPLTGTCSRHTSSTACRETVTTPTTTTTTEIISTTEPTTETTIDTTTITISTEEPESDNICCGLKSGTIIPYPDDSSMYVICRYPLPQLKQCPQKGQYDPVTKSCKKKIQ